MPACPPRTLLDPVSSMDFVEYTYPKNDVGHKIKHYSHDLSESARFGTRAVVGESD